MISEIYYLQCSMLLCASLDRFSSWNKGLEISLDLCMITLIWLIASKRYQALGVYSLMHYVTRMHRPQHSLINHTYNGNIATPSKARAFAQLRLYHGPCLFVMIMFNCLKPSSHFPHIKLSTRPQHCTRGFHTQPTNQAYMEDFGILQKIPAKQRGSPCLSPSFSCTNSSNPNPAGSF